MGASAKLRRAVAATLAVTVIGLTAVGCSSSSSQPRPGGNPVTQAPLDLPPDDLPPDDLPPDIDFDSGAVREVKNGYIKACPTATLGEMADAFFASPSWRDFTSTKGKTVVELEGLMSYKGSPTIAMIQFIVEPLTGFSAEYVEFDGDPQNLLVLSALLTKMCEAT